MDHHYILDAAGEPVPEPDPIAWAEWMAKMGEIRVSDDATGRHLAVSRRGDPDNEVRISTAFLAINHGHPGEQPILWETMVFGGGLDGECARYYSKAEAQEGHALMVRLVEKELRGELRG